MKNYGKIGYVYIVEDKDRGICKIGRSYTPEQRIRGVVSASGANKGRCFISCRCKDMYKLESDTHKKFDKYRTIGEWFVIDFERCVDFVSSIQEEATQEYEDSEKEKRDRSSKKFLNVMKQLMEADANYEDYEALTLKIQIMTEEQMIRTDLRSVGFFKKVMVDGINKLYPKDRYFDCGYVIKTTDTPYYDFTEKGMGFLNILIGEGRKEAEAMFEADRQPDLFEEEE